MSIMERCRFTLSWLGRRHPSLPLSLTPALVDSRAVADVCWRSKDMATVISASTMCSSGRPIAIKSHAAPSPNDLMDLHNVTLRVVEEIWCQPLMAQVP